MSPRMLADDACEDNDKTKDTFGFNLYHNKSF